MSDESTALIPIEEKRVNFYGDEITAVLVEINGRHQIYVPVRPISEYLGLAWSAQLRRMKRDEVLAEGLTSVSIRDTQVQQRYDVMCLQLELLPGWLFGISPSRVRPDLQDKIKRYRRECYQVLWQAFQADVLALVDQDAIENAPVNASLIQIREMGLAIVRMAEQQIEIEQRLNSRLDRAAAVVGNIQRRLSVVERRLSPPEYVTDEMATNIALAVKALAEAFSRRDPRRRFRAPSYDRVRIDKYEDVMKFLEDWQKSIDKQSQPGLFDESPER